MEEKLNLLSSRSKNQEVGHAPEVHAHDQELHHANDPELALVHLSVAATRPPPGRQAGHPEGDPPPPGDLDLAVDPAINLTTLL